MVRWSPVVHARILLQSICDVSILSITLLTDQKLRRMSSANGCCWKQSSNAPWCYARTPLPVSKTCFTPSTGKLASPPFSEAEVTKIKQYLSANIDVQGRGGRSRCGSKQAGTYHATHTRTLSAIIHPLLLLGMLFSPCLLVTFSLSSAYCDPSFWATSLMIFLACMSAFSTLSLVCLSVSLFSLCILAQASFLCLYFSLRHASPQYVTFFAFMLATTLPIAL